MSFEKWWSGHGIEKAEILPVLKLSFKELAKSAWEAALDDRDKCDCPMCNPETSIEEEQKNDKFYHLFKAGILGH